MGTGKRKETDETDTELLLFLIYKNKDQIWRFYFRPSLRLIRTFIFERGLPNW
jgi:hypothetical protein